MIVCVSFIGVFSALLEVSRTAVPLIFGQLLEANAELGFFLWYSVEIIIHGDLGGSCIMREACDMGKNGKRARRSCGVLPLLLPLHVNTRSWSQPLYIFHDLGLT